jgi:hypothetical protein
VYPFGETVTLLRSTVTGQDGYGNDVRTETEVEVAGCAVWPRGSTEQTAGRATVIVGLTAVLPPGTAVAATDRMRVRGLVYAVDGEPGVWTSPLTGTEAGTEVALTRVTG